MGDRTRIRRAAPDAVTVDEAEEESNTSLLVSEVFGPTLQGEGPSAGHTAVFVRLGRCNLSCAWCDTAYTWDGARFDLTTELRRISVDGIVEDVLKRDAGLVVVTGGEPLLQATPLVALVEALRAAGRRVEFETAGTVPPKGLAGLADLFVVSPKLGNSALPASRRLRWSALSAFAELPNAVFKFVLCSPAEFAEVDEIVSRLALRPARVWIMPEGVTDEAVSRGLRELASGVSSRGWSLTDRLHIRLWGDARGR